MKKLLIFFFFLLSVLINAEILKVELKNESIVTGKCITISKSTLYLESNSTLYCIPISEIASITDTQNHQITLKELKETYPKIYVNFNHYPKVVTEFNKDFRQFDYTISKRADEIARYKMYSKKYYYPNLNLLLLTGLSTIVAIDFYYEAQNLREIRKLLETDQLNRAIHRKTISAVVASGVAVSSLIISLQRVEIKVNNKELEVSYKF